MTTPAQSEVSQTVDMGGGVRLLRAVPLRMSDGTVLVADHYFPSEPGPHPTLLMRQPYGRDIASTVVYAHPAWFARQGYNVVIQDVRGRGGSEGEFYPFRHEERDGAETIAAVRQRPECNGKVGMYGFSYQGATQLLAAAAQPEGLLCIAPAMASTDLYDGWFYANGAMRLASSLGWGLQMLKEDARRLGLRQASDRLERAWVNLSAQYAETPYGMHPAIGALGLPTYVQDWMAHDRPGEFWTAMDVSRRLERITVPALHVSGWYDTYLRGTMQGFNQLRQHAGTSHAREHQYLLAGPWVHIPWGERVGGISLGAEAALDTDALLLRWFNHWLKDSGEFDAEPRIRHFAMNLSAAGSWQSANTFPGTTHVLYLHSEGRANSSKGDGTLSPQLPGECEAPDQFVYDPEVPVMAPGGPAALAGPQDQAVMQQGNNLLSYTTAPLKEAMHIFGAPQVSLHVATSAAHADVVARLTVVRPNGSAPFVTLGIARSTHLFGNEYTRDTPQVWQFALEHTSCVLNAGDCLRLDIAGSAWPLFDRNPSNGTPPRAMDCWTWERCTHTVLHDAAHPSVLRLPVATAREVAA